MATFVTYDDSNTKKSVMDVVTNIDPTKTPFLSSLPKVQVGNTRFYWVGDTLAAAAENAAIEGAAHSYPTLTGATQYSNYTQIFKKSYVVSSSEIATTSHGIKDNKAYQLMKKSKEISKDIELALLCGTVVAGNSSTARKLSGAIEFTTTNSTTVVSGGTLTESLFNDLMQMTVDDGGDPDKAYVPPVLKRGISAFTGNSTRFTSQSQTGAASLSNVVDRYRSDFGEVDIITSLQMPTGTNTNTILIIQSDLWKLGILEGVHDLPISEVAQSVDGTAGVIRGELTLVAMAQQSGVQCYGLRA